MDTSLENQQFLYRKTNYILNLFKFETRDSTELKTEPIYKPDKKLFIDSLKIRFPQYCWTTCFTKKPISEAATYLITPETLYITNIIYSINRKLSPNHCRIYNYIAPHYLYILIHYLFRHDSITIDNDLKSENISGAAKVGKLRSWIKADQSLEIILKDVLAAGITIRQSMLPEFLIRPDNSTSEVWPCTIRDQYQFTTPLDMLLGPKAQVWGGSKPYLFNMEFSAEFPEPQEDSGAKSPNGLIETLGETFIQFA
ncbi:hypothetical protein TWF706_010344 [Orbilia oligospora]|nr:hypothetical protein TWF706_010344 [Orbilia oligospora]